MKEAKSSIQARCNHLGFKHELCWECGSIIKCMGCGDQIRFDFWSTTFEEKLHFLLEKEKELKEKIKNIEKREERLKNSIKMLISDAD